MNQRVVWIQKERLNFFKQLEISTGHSSWQEIAVKLGVHSRTLFSWRNGVTRIPYLKLVKICTDFDIIIPEDISLIDEYSHLSSAGHKGAMIKMAKYGPLGTEAGRRKGGLQAIKVMRLANHPFIYEVKIKVPNYSEDLAEFIGIVLGDGNITAYQVKVYGGETTDGSYKYHIQQLGERLFGLKGAIALRKKQDCWSVTFSSIKLVRFLNSQGLKVGSKATYQADFPNWVKDNQLFALACVRGLFDTDGSVYLDRHIINKKEYLNIGVAITSYIPPLLKSIGITLKNMGLSPTISSRRNLLLRKSIEVEYFFSRFKPNNEKHLQRYKDFKLERSSAGFA